MNALDAILAGEHRPEKSHAPKPRKSKAGRHKSASIRDVSKTAWLAVEFERWQRGEQGRRRACERVARRWQDDRIAEGAAEWPRRDRRVSPDTIRTIWKKAQKRRRLDSAFRADSDLEFKAICYAWTESQRTGEDGAAIYAERIHHQRYARRFGREPEPR